jgi:hypothetical protein
MKCHTNINSTPFTQLPHTFSYIVAILGHNHFESPSIFSSIQFNSIFLVLSKSLILPQHRLYSERGRFTNLSDFIAYIDQAMEVVVREVGQLAALVSQSTPLTK